MNDALKLIVVLLLLSGCAHQDGWTRQDTLLQLGVTAMIAADAYTTAKIQYDALAYESGPVAGRVLGRQPTTGDTYLYFTSAAVTSWLVARALPAKWRPYWQVWGIGAHGYAVRRNCNNGLC